MKLRKNWLYLVIFLVIASLFLVACERPLPGGYNDPDAGSDTTQPEVPETVPGVDSEGYPADVEQAEPVEDAPAEAEETDTAGSAAPAEGYPAEEGAVDQGLTAEDEPAGDETAPDAGQTEETTDAEAPAEEAPAVDEATAEGEAAPEESVTEEPVETPGSHTVATGENLYRIGLLYGISWLDLAEANGIVDPANLTVGQVLTIPGADSLAEESVETEEVTDAEGTAAEASEESVEAQAETTEESEQEVVTAETPQGEDTGTPTTYIVLQGENLFRIGVNLGVDWTEIAAANGIVDGQIYPGQELIIPVPSDSDGEAEAVEAEAVEAEAVEPTGEETTYVVQEGDSIYSVAFEHGIPWTVLVEANNIEAPYTLEVGQTLVIVIPVGE